MKKKRLIYVMENLVEVDTKNKNIVFFCNYLKEKGIEVEFLTTLNRENSKINSFGDDIFVTKIEKGVSIKNDEKPIFFPVGYMIKNFKNFDAVWCYLSRASSLYSALMKTFFGKKLIVKCDSVVPKKTTNILKYLWRKFTVDYPIKKADLIIAESKRVYNAVVKYNDRVVLLPNGVSIRNFEIIEQKFKKIKKEEIVLSVGRVEPIKGTLDLIQAFYLFYRRYHNWKLVIVGPIKNKKYLEEINKKVKTLFGKNAPVLISGPKFGEELYALMKRSKIFCIASHEGGDGMSNVLPQAMYLGCHPVITNVGDMDFQLEGLDLELANPRDYLSLAKSIEKASLNPLQEKVLKNHVASRFTWEKNLTKLDKTIRMIKNA